MPAEKKILVVDANILSHALNPSQKEAYAQLFRELETEYSFAVTGFTKFELLRSSDKEHRQKYIEYIDDEMIRIDPSDVSIE